MPTVQIQVRLGSRCRGFTSRASRIAIGRSPHAELVLPFEWVHDVHLIIDNGEQLRVKLATNRAQAHLSGDPLTTDWRPLPSPARIAIPAARGYSLLLDVACSEPTMDMMFLRDNAESARTGSDDGAGAETASLSRFGPAELSVPDPPPSEAGPLGQWSVRVGADEGFTQGQRVSLIVTGCLAMLLVLGALGINRVRHRLAETQNQTQVAAVEERIRRADELIRRKDYTGAKAALDAADELARARLDMPDQRASIAAMRQRPEIRLGAQGMVEMDGQWLAGETARAWRLARERDDPKINQLEQKATIALEAKLYDEGRSACEEALALIESHPVKAHPRAGAIRALLGTLKTRALATEMLAKGYVQYQDRWVTAEEKTRLEHQAKGLVEYQGEWMTKEEAAAAEKRGTGRVFYEGKWMTPDQKMEAQGYVKFEGQWMRPEDRDAVVAKRNEEKDRAAAATRAAADLHAAEEQAQKLKPAAYTKSQELVKKKYPQLLSAKFEAFGTGKVQVIFDDGWFIVRAPAVLSSGSGVPVTKTYYCKLRPTHGDEWETDTTILAD